VNDSPLWGENADFRYVSKFNTRSLPLCGKATGKKRNTTFFAPTAGVRRTMFTKLCSVIEDVEPIKKVWIIFRSNA